jgi:hypothetical protein
VIEVPEELVEPVLRRQVLVAVTQVVLAELARGVAERLERLGNRDVPVLQAHGRAGNADLRETRPQRHLPGDER